MAAGAAEEISSILLDVLEQNLDYCALCLRTNLQRKLLVSDTFTLFSKKLRLRAPQNKHLCFVCEAHVSRAWRTLHAVTFAATINTWFQGAGRRLGQRRTLKQDLQEVTKMLRFGSDQTLEQFWEDVRVRSRLALTEPLVVGSQPIDEPTHASTQGSCSTAPAQEEWQFTVEMRDGELPSQPPGVSFSQPPDPNPVVIIEDDDPPIKPEVAQLVSIDQFLDGSSTNHYSLTADSQQLLTRDKKDPQSIILYPIVTGIDRKMYVPSLNARIENGLLEIVNENELTKNIYHDKYTNYNLKQDVVALKGDMVKVKVVEKATPMLTIRGVEGGKLIEEKQAVASDSKVDWEDKIPMDVISFVDATDPNADQYIVSEPFSIPDQKYQSVQSQTELSEPESPETITGSPSPSPHHSPTYIADKECWANLHPILNNHLKKKKNSAKSVRKSSESVGENSDSDGENSDSDGENSDSVRAHSERASKKSRLSETEAEIVIDLC